MTIFRGHTNWRGAFGADFDFKIAEAIGLRTDAFERFFEGIGESASGTKRQDKLKLVKYPDMKEIQQDGESAQGGVYDPFIYLID